MESSEPDAILKIIVLGDSMVGKTSIMYRYTTDEFEQSGASTIGIEFCGKTIKMEGKTLKLRIWDTAGQEKFKSLATSYYTGSDGAILVYDVTNKDSLDHIESWRDELQKKIIEDIPIILCGSKIDLTESRTVSSDEGSSLADKNNMGFIETSSKDGTNVSELFESLVSKIITKKFPC